MGSVRRWYVYLVSAITLNVIAWAFISLLRNLLIRGGDAPKTAIAFQIAVLIVGLPLFLVHWLWAMRTARGDVEEREAFPRRLYFYSMMTGFLAPIVNSGYLIIRGLLYLIFDVELTGYRYAYRASFTTTESIFSELIAVLVIGALWFYHRSLARTDAEQVGETEPGAVLGQIYTFGFSGTGLVLSTLGVISLLRWLMELLAVGRPAIGSQDLMLAREIAHVIMGIPLWLGFWLAAQRRFDEPDSEERESLARKIYLHLVVFLAVLAVLTPVTIVLADILGRIMSVPGSSDEGIYLPLAIVLVNGAVWTYHASILRRDASLAGEGPPQAAVRRVYVYLMATLGLAALLVGIAGDLSVLIRALFRGSFTVASGLREQLAWFTAAILAGLPLWLFHWWRIQRAVVQADAGGRDERRSEVRRIYLYFYLFVATMTVLSSVIFIVAQLVGLAVGARRSAGLMAEIGQALAYTIIAVLVWLYHGTILRRENRQIKQEEAKQAKSLLVAVVDVDDGSLGRVLVERLQRDVPGVKVHPLGLNPTAAAAMNGGRGEKEPVEILAEAEVIVGPWTMAVPGAAEGQISVSIANTVFNNPARKLFIPVRGSGWEWAGVEPWKVATIAKEVSSTVKQMSLGEKVKSRRRLSVAVIVVIVLVSLCILLTVGPSLIGLFLY